MLRRWDVRFMENGDEYAGHLVITAMSVVQIEDCVLMADGVRIEIDEPILSIEVL